jgi:hypothetical protein
MSSVFVIVPGLRSEQAPSRNHRRLMQPSKGNDEECCWSFTLSVAVNFAVEQLRRECPITGEHTNGCFHGALVEQLYYVAPTTDAKRVTIAKVRGVSSGSCDVSASPQRRRVRDEVARRGFHMDELTMIVIG